MKSMKNVPHRCAFVDDPSLHRDYVPTTLCTICNLVGNRFRLGIDTINVSELDPPITERYNRGPRISLDRIIKEAAT